MFSARSASVGAHDRALRVSARGVRRVSREEDFRSESREIDAFSDEDLLNAPC